MDHFQRIYTSRAADYQRMISVEDCDHNLIRALESITTWNNRKVIDLGTGTGRVPLLLSGMVGSMTGIDLYGDMLRQNALGKYLSLGDWDLIQADMRRIPIACSSADIVTAGWSIGHLRAWFSNDWQAQIGQVLEEMQRIVLPGGSLIIMETLGTGSLNPAPPTPELAEYFTWLESVWEFHCIEVSTDYSFDSVDEAVASTEFFFGLEMANKIRQNSWARLPEWTGIWSKTA